MKVDDLKEKLNLKFAAGQSARDREVEGMYVCDLLSWVMGRAQENQAWVTIQGHINIIAVALLTGVSCVILAEDSPPDADMMEKAEEEGIPVLTTSLTAYEVARQFAFLERM